MKALVLACALALGALGVLGTVPVRAEPAAAPAALSETFEKQIQQAVDRYVRLVAEYNKNPELGAPWFEKPLALDLESLPAAATPEETRLRDLVSRSLLAAEQFRGSHKLATDQGENLIGKKNGELSAVEKIALLGMRATLGHSYKRWMDWNDLLARQILQHWGQALPKPVPPPYLERLRAYSSP